MILAGVAIAAAGFLLLSGDYDKAFVVAAVGLVAWFLNYRMQMKELVASDDTKSEEGSGPTD